MGSWVQHSDKVGMPLRDVPLSMTCPGSPLEPFSREPFLFLFPPLGCKLHCSLGAVFFLLFPEENIFHQQQSWFLDCSTAAAELKTHHSICQGDFSQLKKRKT